MNKRDTDILIKAFKIIAKDVGYPTHNCKEHAINCFQCQMKRFMDDFYSLMTFYMEIDFSLKDLKTHKKKI